ncbi:MAG: hydantoinase/oxoprolinase family protein [SAR324 cluster bacterium]|nr:hydantoinase/oxoprolinase family protein [SAR324 cluster bacterium]
MSIPIRLAADIGGTFTDVVLESEAGFQSTKVLTTLNQPEIGVMQGIDELLRLSNIEPGQITHVIHGTTLGTNTVIERKGAKTAFLTTEGFRDILEMGYEKRYDHYDIYLEKPPPLIPRKYRLPVRERISAEGKVLVELDQNQVQQTIQFLKQEEIEAVAIGFLHAYAHPVHEQKVRDLILSELPGLSVCLSSEVCPEMREYDRFSTTCANAYIRPLVSGYLERLEKLFAEAGFGCSIHLMMSGGGWTNLQTASKFPIRLLESGPAGGAIMAAGVARECELDEVLSLDMGGTTAKICLIRDGVPESSRSFETARVYRDQKGSGLPLRVPVIELVEIGAGGGSIARVDAMKRIRVGPRSAGSEPGPASYGLGGGEPTVTDANLLLGNLNPEYFGGGKITLNLDLAEQAVNQKVAGMLELDKHWASLGILETVDENMANAAKVHAVERGRVLNRHAMIAFGGGAPLHACRIARKLGIERVIIPKGAGVGSALGFLRAPMSFEVVRSFKTQFSHFELEQVNRILEEMSREAHSMNLQQNAGSEETVEERKVDVRYLGQGHELTIPINPGKFSTKDVEELREKFEELYHQIYGLNLPEMEVEAISWSVTVKSPEATTIQKNSEDMDQTVPESIGLREVFDTNQERLEQAKVYNRSDLSAGQSIHGLCVIQEPETTVIVPQGFMGWMNPFDHIILEDQNKKSIDV